MIQYERDPTVAGPLIRGFSGRSYRVDDRIHDGAMLLTPESALDWQPPALDELTGADVAVALALRPAPEFLLLGTGATLLRPSARFVRELEAQGCGVEPMDSRAAARAWGMLRGEGRWIAAALYPLY